MKSFLTIGQLSKLSNIHIKALRYYESINILEPTYIDPNNSYRYYSHANVLYVKTIKICADYGIPLKTFRHFINEKNEILMDEILQLAQKIIEEKEQTLKKDKAHIEDFKLQIKLSKQLDQTSHYHMETNDEDYLLIPFEGEMLSDDYYVKINDILTALSLSSAAFNQRVGCYFKRSKDSWIQYLACKIKHFSNHKLENTLCLNGTHVHGEHITKENIIQRINELNTDQDIQEILILETIESPYKFTNPHLELRYFL
ncbi:TPA: MerR family DNA-binding transcriptional regulator [Streptococcus suis]|nr:MerR family DNA-binding transcriptional regulator [Streptococcus suis]